LNKKDVTFMTNHDDMEKESLLEETSIIETTDEDGQVHIFEKISEFEFSDQDYALLVYRGTPEQAEAYAANANSEDEEEVVVMRLGEEDGQEVFEAIEDEEEFARVVEFLDSFEDENTEINVGDVLAQMAQKKQDETP
jgi:uncharacterized protein YrzB (UPF0473 family)